MTKPSIIAICAMLAMPCGASAQDAAASAQTPVPDAAWAHGVRPGFIRSVGFAEGTPGTPVKPRSVRPDLGPVYAWKGTPLWLVVDVEATSRDPARLCVEWPKPDPGAPPLRDCQAVPEGRGQLRFAAPGNRDWPEDRYAARLSTYGRCPPGVACMVRALEVGIVHYGIGDAPAAANGHGTGHGVGHGEAPGDVPAFPWPPPRATVRTVLDRGSTFGPATDLGDVAERLAGALHAAGYESPAYYSAPGGYAMVARLEQIEPDGTPKPVPMRWSAELPRREVFTLGDYFRALFEAPQGHYRVIVFVVSDQPFTTARGGASHAEAEAWLHGGLNVLPAAIAALPLDPQHICTALIYQFRKQGFQGEPVGVLDGAPAASLQLQRTRILDRQGRLNR